MKHAVTAIFDNPHDAGRAVDELIGMGVDRDEISVLMSESARTRNFSAIEGGSIRTAKISKGDKSEEGAAAGAAIGGALGAIVAVAVTAGVLVAPGLGLMAAGPIVTAFAGAGAGGTAGGIVGFLVGMGVEEDEAKLWSKQMEKDSVLIGVKSDRDAKVVTKVLQKHNGKTNKSSKLS